MSRICVKPFQKYLLQNVSNRLRSKLLYPPLTKYFRTQQLPIVTLIMNRINTFEYNYTLFSNIELFSLKQK